MEYNRENRERNTPRRRTRQMVLTNKKNWIIFLCLFLFILTIFTISQIPSKNYTPPEELSGIPLFVNILEETNVNRPGRKRKVQWIVVHDTANKSKGANAQRHNEYIHNNTERTVSWHYTVDDKQIYQHLPDNEVGWHAGDKLTPNGGNSNGIGVELCVNEDGDYSKTEENAEKLVAFLLHQHGLTVKDVKQHADFMDKNCPAVIRDSGTWDAFLKKVEVELKKLR